MPSRTDILQFLQRKAQSILQPLHEGQDSLKYESLRRLDDSIRRLDAHNAALRDLTVSVLSSRWLTAPDVLASRNEVGFWLNWLGLAGEGVEVGVYKGEFSFHLLNTWECRRLTSIDPWKEFASSEYIDALNVSREDQERNCREAMTRLAAFGERSNVVRATSSEGACQIADRTLDFAYIDAQHHYEAVREDLLAWYPKVRSGGVLGGHDYLDGAIPSGVYGVKRAVDDFAAARGVEIIVTREPVWKSWFMRMP